MMRSWGLTHIDMRKDHSDVNRGRGAHLMSPVYAAKFAVDPE